MTGLHLAQYRIDSELGRGGMGIVYRATDTKLDRTVALKVLPPHSLASADDRARFYREAKAAAQLSHAHIATVYQVDEAEVEGSLRPFIAMEFIDGESLADRIARGPLKLEEAVRLATEVAEALRAAHAKGIVHRDIKSANVMLTQAGSAKVLDFGLAKTQASTQLTRQGSTLGTVAYMSPEQARGQEVDGRSDLYSLGTVFYEMVAGRLPFAADYEQAVLYGIMNEDPEPLTAVRTGVPMDLERIVFRLLAKEPRHRYQTAADLVADLGTLDLHGASGVTTRTTIRAAPAPSRRRLPVALPAGTFAAGVLAVAVAWALWPSPEPIPRPQQVLDVKMAADHPVVAADLSADGSILAYATDDLSRDNVFVRDLTTGEVRRIAGSAGALVVELSPDGESVLITKQLSVERTSLRSGTPLLVVEAEEGNPRANWGPPGWVIYEDLQALWKVSLETGKKAPLAVRPPDGIEQDYDWPELLPDGRTVMALVENSDGTMGIGFWDFESGDRLGTTAVGGRRPQYLATGHLIFSVPIVGATGNLVSVPFDPVRLRVLGAATPIAAEVLSTTVSVSGEGTLVYRRSATGADVQQSSTRPLAGIQVSEFPGNNRIVPVAPARFADIELSPDETRAVLTIQDPSLNTGQGTGTDVFVLDVARGSLLQLTFNASGASPTWVPGGDSVAYVDQSRATQGITDVNVRAADGTGAPRRLFRSTVRVWDLDLSPAGDAAVYVAAADPFGVSGIVVRKLETGEVIELTDRRTANRRYPEFSPDGSTIVYEQDGETYTAPADGRGVPINRSTGRWGQPTWSADGRKIYGLGSTGLVSRELESATVDFEVGFTWSETYFYDVFSSGDRMLMTSPGIAAGGGVGPDGALPSDSTESLVFVINFAENLRGQAR
jgi:Tol biopolymer transport system component/predicted Ser/Thr protein kinase